MTMKKKKGLPKPYTGTYYTINGQKKPFPNLYYFMRVWEDNMEEKEIASKEMKELIMEFVVTKESVDSEARMEWDERTSPIKGTLKIMEGTLKSVKHRREPTKNVANKTEEEKAEIGRRNEPIDFLISCLKTRIRKLKYEIKKLEKKQEEQV